MAIDSVGVRFAHLMKAIIGIATTASEAVEKAAVEGNAIDVKSIIKLLGI